MASTSLNEANTTEKINLDDIEFPEGPEDNAPELEIVKLKDDSDDDSESSKTVTGKKKENEKKKEEEEEVPKMGRVGLNNMGNTCYLNSVLQTISNMDDFRKFLLEGSFLHNMDKEKDLEDTLFFQTHRIVNHLWKTTSDSLSPKSFREKFIEKQKQFYGYEQQDSHEAIQFLFDNLHEEIKRKITINISLTDEMTAFSSILDNYFTNKDKFGAEEKISKKMQIKKLINEKRMHSLDYFAMKYLTQFANNYSEIYDYFGIMTCEIKKCPECNHIKYNFDQNYIQHVILPDLDDESIMKSKRYLELFEKKKEELKDKVSDENLISKFCVNEIKNEYVYDLDDLLSHGQIPEIMDEKNLWNCPNCSKKVRAISQTKVFKASKYFIIHFKRFKHVIQNDKTFIFKVKNLIKYNKYIDIKNLMIKEPTSAKYELVSGILHMGEYNGGHFTSFALNNDKWVNYNDPNVSDIKISKDDIPLSSHAYMLIYKQI